MSAPVTLAAPAQLAEPVSAYAVEPAPAAAPAITVAPTPVAAPAAAAPAPGSAFKAPAAAPAPVKLDTMLADAGLQLASTDPEKLRAAQAAAEQAAAPVRVGRARKPVAAPVDEPLIQVDTRQ